MKDHEKREIINAITEIAIKFAGTHQLRERIAEIVSPLLNDETQFNNLDKLHSASE